MLYHFYAIFRSKLFRQILVFFTAFVNFKIWSKNTFLGRHFLPTHWFRRVEIQDLDLAQHSKIDKIRYALVLRVPYPQLCNFCQLSEFRLNLGTFKTH